MRHVVTIQHQTPKTRAECSCSWTSPWITAGPPDPDIPPRTDMAAKAARAAQWHVQQAARP
jgi:hypothetical protein